MPAIVLCALVALSGVRCVQDFASSSQRAVYTFSVSPVSVSLNIGDTILPFTGTLTVSGRPAPFHIVLALIDSNGTVALDSLGRIAVKGRGSARLEARAQSPALEATVPVDTVVVRGVVPAIGLSTARGVDTLKSIGDTMTLLAVALTTRGDTIRGVPISWTTMAGGAVANLMDPSAGTIRSSANGSALFRASVDNASADRTVIVKQRAATLLPAVDSVLLRAQGETWQLTKVARDARGNVIVGATQVWTGGTAAIATVSSTGLATAQGDGVSQARARMAGGTGDSLTATTVITVARARLKLVSGDAQSGTVGATVAAPLVVQLVDSLGGAVARSGVGVVFAATTSGTKVGGADSVTVATDASGQASTSLTLSGTAGTNHATARGVGLAGLAITFSATGTSSGASTIAAVSGNNQSGTVNTSLAAPFVVGLKDGFGNAVAGQRVVFRVTAGGGKLAGADSLAVNTDAQGRASATLTLGKTAGTNTVTASSAGTSGSPVTFGATGTPGAATALAVTVSPANGSAGTALSPAPQVAVKDGFGNTVTGSTASIALAIVPGTGTSGATLSGTTSVAAAGGVATFAGLSIAKAGAGYRLVATSTGLSADTTTAFTISSASAGRLAFSVQPSRTAAGTAVAPAIQVSVLDTLGNPVPGATNVVTISLGTTPAGGGGLFGTLQVAASNGVAIFSDVHISKTGVGYKVVAQAPGLVATTSNAFDIVAGAPASIAKISGDNQNQVPGAALGQPLVAQMKDAFLNAVPGDTVVFKVTSGGGKFGTADSAVTTTDSQGNASASYTLGPTPGTNTIQAHSRRLPDSLATFTESATQPGLFLKFTVQPSAATGGVAIAPAIKVAVQDALGNTQTSATTNVTLTLQGGTAGAALSGTLAVAAVNGVATFSNVAVDKAGSGYQLVASASGVTGTTSAAFDVTTGPAARVRFATSPGAATAGADLGGVQVRIEDAGGNLELAASDAVTLAIANNTGKAGAHLRGTTTVNASGGVAQFTGLSIDSAGTGYKLRATDGTLTAATSPSFTVSAAPASRLTFNVQPSTVAAGASITPAIQVAVRDSIGNLATSGTPALTLAITAGTGTSGATLSGGSATAQSGVASFGSVSINRSGSAYTLTASGTALASAVSAAFNVATASAESLVVVSGNNQSGAPGSALAAPFVVQVRDHFGDAIGGFTVRFKVTAGGGKFGAADSAIVTTDATGRASATLTLGPNTTTNTAEARATGLLGSPSVFTATATAVASKLAFVTQPSNATAGAGIAPAVQVAVQTSDGVTVTGSTAGITLALGGGTAGAHLRGTQTVNAVNGVATFNVSVDSAGSGYALTASSSSLASATSAAFAIAPAPPVRLAFIVQPSTRTAGSVISPAVQVAVRDSLGNRTSGTNSVAVGIASGTGATGAVLSGTSPVAAVNGVAAFPDLSIDKAATGYRIAATSSGLAPDTSVAFNVTTGAPASVAVTPATTTLVAVGATVQLTATARDSGGNTLAGQTFTWRSSDTTVATVSAAGLATAVKNGTATITATDNGASGSATVTVTQAVSSVAVSPASAALTAVGQTQQFTATARDANGNAVSGQSFAWVSSDTTVATVNASGLATARGQGNATITATTAGVFGTASLSVAQSIASVTVAPASASLTALGQTQQFTATASDGNGNPIPGATFSWNSSDVTVATVSTSGLATAVANGTVQITASAGGKSGSASLAVAQVTASVVVTPATATLGAIGSTQQLSAQALDANSHPIAGKAFAWASDAPSVASVSSSGVVTAAGNGTAHVSASADGKSGQSTITVSQVVTSVAVSPASATLASLGQTQQFTATARDANGNPVPGVTFTWTSGNTAVATVDGAGLATATGSGSATIGAAGGGSSGTANLTVAQTTASITVTPASASFGAIGSTRQFAAQAFDAGGHPIAGKTFTWASDAAAVATVTSSGLVTSAGNGTAHVTASVDGMNGSATITVAQVVTSVAVSPPNLALASLGATGQLAATAADSNGNVVGGQTFAWATDASGVASVDAAGLVTAVANGTAHVSATTAGVSGSATVTVAQVTASVAVSPASATLATLGRTQAFTAQALDARGNVIAGRSFAWSSDAPAVATVDAASGVATATGNGTAHISAAVDGKTGSATLTVQQVVAAVTVSPAHDSLTALNATRQFTAQATDSAGSPVAGAAFAWSSSATSVATIDGTGLATAAGNGGTTITATVNGVSGTASLAVWQAIATVTISPASFSLSLVNPTRGLQATAFDAGGNAVTRPVTWAWSSSDTNVITVDTTVTTGSNTATRAGPGSATITAAAEGVLGTSSGTVAL